jgi:hypothetical protein
MFPAGVASAVVVAAVVASAEGPPPVRAQRESAVSAPCADTNAVVQRAVAYVAQFGRDLGSVIATEDYQQELVGAVDAPQYTPPPITIVGGIQVQPAAPMTARPSARQRLRSSFLFVQLTDGPGWVGFREVLEVNGKRVGQDQRSGTALDVPGESTLDRWRRLSEESARYNIGSIRRTLNVPTFALLVLHAENQSRFSFTPAAGAGAAGSSTCDVDFQETESPTIIRNGVGGDVPSSGTFRIEPATGRVVRSELIAGSTATGVASKALVSYEHDRKLQLWVPREMREEYVAGSNERLHCVARYSSYRRAEVTSRIRPGM